MSAAATSGVTASQLTLPLSPVDFPGAEARELGALWALADAYWRTGRAIPDDEPTLRRLTGLSRHLVKKFVKKLHRWFDLVDGWWVHEGLEAKLESRRFLREKRRRAGRLGGRAKKSRRRPAQAPASLLPSLSESESCLETAEGDSVPRPRPDSAAVPEQPPPRRCEVPTRTRPPGRPDGARVKPTPPRSLSARSATVGRRCDTPSQERREPPPRSASAWSLGQSRQKVFEAWARQHPPKVASTLVERFLANERDAREAFACTLWRLRRAWHRSQAQLNRRTAPCS